MQVTFGTTFGEKKEIKIWRQEIQKTFLTTKLKFAGKNFDSLSKQTKDKFHFLKVDALIKPR